MSPELDVVEKRVWDALQAVDLRWRSIGDSSAAWTREIKNAVGRVGEDLGHLVCAAESNYSSNGEWLYDMTWLKIADDLVLEIPLALESEWTPDEELLQDFQKLVVSRARHRVMVFWAGSKHSLDRVLTGFVRQVDKFHGTTAGDRYLFAYWVGEDQPIEFTLYVAK